MGRRLNTSGKFLPRLFPPASKKAVPVEALWCVNLYESLAPIEKVRESFPPWLLLLANRDFRQGLTLGDSHTVV